MTKKEKKKIVLIHYLDEWSKLKHIQSRHLFALYKDRLLKDKYLTDGMVNHIVVFLEREVDTDRSSLLDSLSDFKRQTEPPTATLDRFFQ